MADRQRASLHDYALRHVSIQFNQKPNWLTYPAANDQDAYLSSLVALLPTFALDALNAGTLLVMVFVARYGNTYMHSRFLVL